MSDFQTPAATRKARQPHACATCSREIRPGESYRHQTGVWDGRWYLFDQCAHCQAIWAIYRPSSYESMISEEGYLDWAEEGSTAWGRDDLADIRELRYRVQYRMGWRSKAGKLFPIPTAPASTPDLVAGRMNHLLTTAPVLTLTAAPITKTTPTRA